MKEIKLQKKYYAAAPIIDTIVESVKDYALQLEILKKLASIPGANVVERDQVCPHYFRNVHDRGDDSVCEKYSCEAKDMTHWIPVSERLPEPYEDVLIYYHHGNEIAIDCMDVNGHWSVFDITHWMPLPEPPKGVK